MSSKLSHLDSKGRARMVNVGQKQATRRIARAVGEVIIHDEALEMIRKGVMEKGDVISIAEIAGVLAAKQTSSLIPLCHPLNLSQVIVQIDIIDDLPGVRIMSKVEVDGKTGVEMEALTAVSVAALTVYDMVKAVDKRMKIQNIHLVEKRGGSSGDFFNEE